MKKKTKRVVPALLSLVMAVSSVPGPAYGAPLVTLFSSAEDDTQMVSDAETVFVNFYDGSVRSQDFNSNWKFFLGNAGNAQEVNFDDSKWKAVSLPHDYSIEQDYSPNMEAESGYLPGGTGWYRKNFTVPKEAATKQVRVDFDGVYMNATVYINGHQVGTHPYGYSPFSFDLTPYLNYGGDNLIAVKVDHKTPSSRWYSGSGIYRDVKLTITPMVHEALHGTKVELPDLESNKSNPSVHVETAVQNESGSEAEVTVSHRIYRKDDDSKTPIGEITADPVKVASGATVTVESDMTASNPEMWTLDDPQLYVMETKISTGGGISDVTTSDFGFRYFDFDSSTGFSLNGENMKLKGVCMHHDQGSLGAEAWDRAIERQVEILKDMGCNAIRVTHNPAAQDLIDICNEKGMLVIEEMFDGWHGAKNQNSEDYAKWYGKNIEDGNLILGQDEGGMTWAEFDMKSVIRRDWNAPSVISWSLGNEVMEGIGIGVGDYPNQAQKLIDWAVETDDTRPVTTGDNKLKSGLAQSQQIGEKLAAEDGLVGFNYTALNGNNTLSDYHTKHPEWNIYGSETASSINSRGVYKPSLYDRQLTAYDESRVNWGHLASDAWYTTIQKDFVAGEFVWTGFDYIGEPTNWNGITSGAQGAWPSPKNSYFGIIDTAGLPKDSYYLYQSLWNEYENTLHILPAWNGDVIEKDDQGNVKVVVYSDAPTVDLFFTPEGGQETSLGSKAMTEKHSQADDGSEGLYTYQMYEGDDKDSTAHKNLYRTWKVPYQDGTLRAVAKDASGREISNTVGRNVVKTAGKAAKIEAEADRDRIDADGDDLSYITVTITDENGTMVPDADNRVKFTVEGDGKLVGLDNGWTTDHDSYQADNRRAFNGQLVAIVQSTEEDGSFTLKAEADGLKGCEVTVDTEAVESGETDPGADNMVASYEISKNYYVKVGYEPVLPETLPVTYTDGTTAELSVVWDTIPQDKLDEEGSFLLSGDMEGTKVSVSINMISQIAAILNYSTTVHLGEAPLLPESRQLVSEDGEILNIALPVEWDERPADDYKEEGIVTVNGTVSVFGEPMDVTASVRVQKEKAVITDNVGTKAKVSQTVGTPSDALSAINDGSTKSVDNPSSPNNSRWSNWDYTKKTQNDPPAELQFVFDTQETLGQIKIYFVRDNGSLRFPDPGITKIYVSNDMKQWTELHTLGVKETIPDKETSSMVKCYTYDFAPLGATYLKLEIHNNKAGSAGAAGAEMPTTGITEVELYRSEGRFTANSSTALSSLTLNGVEAPESALKAGEYNTPMSVVEELQAVSEENAAITVLPAADGQVKILLESEDHSKMDEFIIHLEQDSTGSADDDSMDYPVKDMKVTVGNEHGTDKKENALDNNYGTVWHTDWNNVTPVEKRWIQLELDKETNIDALRYYSRNDGPNGRVNKYKVEVSSDGKDWKTVSTGNWKNEGGWKLAAFEEPVKAKFVKLTGVETYGNTANMFMSAAEVRVRTARETTKLTEDNVTLSEDTFIMDEDQTPVKPEVSVSIDGKALRYGIDYTVNYENNDKPGIGTVIVKGIMDYSGVIRLKFRIVGSNTQNVTVLDGTITKLDDQELEGQTQIEAESGRIVTVKADVKDGMEFDHWRTAPANLLSKEDMEKEEVSFIIPESGSRLQAVYREEGEDKLSEEAYTTAEPSNWFAFGDESDMEALLEAALTDSDEVILQRGGSAEVKMNLERSKKEPSKMDILKSYELLASPSDAEEEEDDDDKNVTSKATASNAEKSETVKASASDAEETLNPRDILKDEVLSPLKAVKEEAGLNDDEEAARTTKIAFWIRTTAEKVVTNSAGNPTRTQLVDPKLPEVQITAELPKDDRRMEDYQVMRYEYSEDGTSVSVVSCEVEGNNLIFDAAPDGVYAVMYTQCFDVIFEDYDKTVLSKQRVAYGNAAEAPEDPKREGYTFAGWNKDFDYVTSDMRIRAVYEEGEEKPEVNKNRLEAKIEEIQRKMDALDEDDYTSSSWSKLEDALDEAIAVLEDEDATQSQVNKAAEKLDKAYKALKRIGGGSSHSGGSGGSGHSSSRPLYGNSKPQPLDGGAYVTNGTWTNVQDGWTFTKENGEKAVSCWIYTLWGDSYEWYYFNAEGKMATGWVEADGQTFYLNPVSDGTRGKMMTGWQLIDGKYYYFNTVSDGTRGALYRNRTTPDGYQVGADGVWIQ